ncbi:cation efflux system protein [Capnocytophaga felis]|uniref:Cation efflux system protein n=2 Tax=Capnocytophaga felis TaxID=2267611 RepID=A0A5M4BBT0_9FLAO|nr:cation efflux system protein [Capnocytophaga felis]GET49589.1 cation efflux system protein [Capnocytophaga felis]
MEAIGTAMKKITLSTIGLIFLLSCKTETTNTKEENVQQLLLESPTEVTIIPLQSKPFTHELVSNGKIHATQMVGIKFKANEKIARILVKNGDNVTQGQIIATLEGFSFENKLQQAQDEVSRARLELQDMLIGQGFKLKDSANVPPQTMELLKVKSGYNKALSHYKMVKNELQSATLYAPISGTIANLNSKPNTYPDMSKDFCNIVNLHSMEVSFPIMESELGFVQKGGEVEVIPFSMPDVKIKGKITEINPWVDQNGMVQLKASVAYHPKMVEGMSVRVSIFRALEKQWVVPKSAVVLRTNRKVLFTLKDGKAFWNYIETGLENATEYTITGETLKEGDPIIISGNINLAHESPVKVK